MYQVQKFDTSKALKTFEDIEEAKADAQRRANRCHAAYCVMWFEPGVGTTMQMFTPQA